MTTLTIHGRKLDAGDTLTGPVGTSTLHVVCGGVLESDGLGQAFFAVPEGLLRQAFPALTLDLDKLPSGWLWTRPGASDLPAIEAPAEKSVAKRKK